MNAKGKIREGVYTIIFTMVITTVCVATVAFAYQQTRPRIKLNESLFLKKAVLAAAGLMPQQATPETVAKIFQDKVKTEKIAGLDFPVYRLDNGGYVLEITGTGLWGEIVGEIGVGPGRDTLTGVSFIRNSETPGLGARITEPWFEQQFKGKQGPLSLVPEGTKSATATQFDAITGATVTSNGVREMVNRALEMAARLPRPEVKK